MRRLLRSPSFQFLLIFVTSPIIAIFASSFGDPTGPLGTAGWIITLLIIFAAGVRSYRHERAQFPEGSIFQHTTGWRTLIVRYMVGLATLLVFVLMTILMLLIRLLSFLFAGVEPGRFS